MSCSIQEIKAPNGKPSKIFASISNVYGAEVGLIAYLHMRSDLFKNENPNAQMDENGEYNWKLVLDSMEKSGHSIKSIVEKSMGVKRQNDNYVIFKLEEANTKLSDINKLFLRENLPFMASKEFNENGEIIISIELITGTNLMPRDYSEDDRNAASDYIDIIGQEEVMSRHRDQQYESAQGLVEDELDRKKPKLQNHKYKALLKSIAIQIAALERRIAKVESNLKIALENNDTQKATLLKQQLANHTAMLNTFFDKQKNVFKQDNSRKIANVGQQELNDITKKIQDINNLEIEELLEIQRILGFWINAGKFDENGTHLLLNSIEQKSQPMKELYQALRNQAEGLSSKVNVQLNKKFDQFLKEYISPTATTSDAMKLAKDIGFLDMNILDISRTDNVILQAIYKAVTQQEQRANQEADVISKKVDEMLPKVMESLKRLGKQGEDPFEFFMQTNAKGQKSGDMVTAISYDFIQEKQKNVYEALFGKHTKKVNKKTARAWSKENEIVADYRKLFYDHSLSDIRDLKTTFTKEDRDKHISELEKILGAEKTASIIKQMESQLVNYQLNHEAVKARLLYNKNADNSADAERKLKIWEGENSPFYASKNYISGNKIIAGGKTVKSKVINSLVFIPKKEINGKQTGWYDNKYETIQNDPALKEFYDFYVKTMKELNMFIPISKRNKFKENSISFVEKTMQEMSYTKDGKVHKGFASFAKKSMTEAFRSKEYSNVTGASFDPVTGEKIRHVQANFINDGKAELTELVRNKQVAWQGMNPKEKVTADQLRTWRYEALNELAERKSYNIGQALKSYAMLANAYKYKSVIEDDINLAYNMFNNIKEKLTNTRDAQLINQYGEEQFKNGLSKMKAQLDYFLDKFNNFTTRDDSVTQTKLFTEDEKLKKAELEKALVNLEKLFKDSKVNKKEYATLKANILEQIDKLGGNLSITKLGDAFLNFSQIKGMGWNIPAGIVNRLFGLASNLIESASGRFFSTENFSIANKMVTGLMSSENKTKAINIAKRWGIVEDMNNEFETGIETSILGKLPEKLQPYYLNKAVELRNQAPILIAKLLDTKVNTKEDGTGKEISLFEALDENGHIKPEYEHLRKDWDGNNADRFQNKKKQELIGAVSQIIKKVHGNYHRQSPLLAKKTLFGRALLQFKSWIGESIANRFELEKDDAVLGYKRKGRYRTMWTATTKDGQEILGARELLNNFSKMMSAIFFNNLNNINSFNLADIDIENVRAMAREIQMILAFAATGLALFTLREGLDDDDEDERLMKYAATFTLNNINKTMTDLSAFLSPVWVFNLIDRPIAAVSITNDITDNISSAIKILSGDYEISSGIHAGWNRPLKEVIELMPITNQLFKIKSMSQRIYSDPKDIKTAIDGVIADWIYGEDEK